MTAAVATEQAPRPPRYPSLPVELLLNLGVLATAALLLAVVSSLVFRELVDSRFGALYLTGLIGADVAIFVLFGAYQVRRLVLRPMANAVAAAEDVAGGNLSRRLPLEGTTEFVKLAESFNRMTARLVEEQAHLVRVEKLASVGRLAAGVAHEIGNPLGAINAYTHIVRKRAGAAPDVAEALDGIERESARIDRIVRGLLDYARPRRRSPTEVDVNGAVRRVLDMLRDQGTLKRVEITTSLEAGVPTLAGDRHELEQALVNLVLNAVDALRGDGRISIVTQRVSHAELWRHDARRAGDPDGLVVPREPGGRLRAWLNAVGEPREVVKIVVADSGPGVPDEDAERVFDPFFTTKPPGKGTGLGLAIVSRIVDGLRGVVYVRRAREGGAAFVMLFPVAEAAAGAVALQGAGSFA